jgi:hypothetical protein
LVILFLQMDFLAQSYQLLAMCLGFYSAFPRTGPDLIFDRPRVFCLLPGRRRLSVIWDNINTGDLNKELP